MTLFRIEQLMEEFGKRNIGLIEVTVEQARVRKKGARGMSDTGQQGQHGEPWELVEHKGQDEGGYVHVTDNNRVTLICGCTRPDNARYENELRHLKHVVACVNGCAGINAESVPKLLKSLTLIEKWSRFEDGTTLTRLLEFRDDVQATARAVIGKAKAPTS